MKKRIINRIKQEYAELRWLLNGLLPGLNTFLTFAAIVGVFQSRSIGRFIELLSRRYLEITHEIWDRLFLAVELNIHLNVDEKNLLTAILLLSLSVIASNVRTEEYHHSELNEQKAPQNWKEKAYKIFEFHSIYREIKDPKTGGPTGPDTALRYFFAALSAAMIICVFSLWKSAETAGRLLLGFLIGTLINAANAALPVAFMYFVNIRFAAIAVILVVASGIAQAIASAGMVSGPLVFILLAVLAANLYFATRTLIMHLNWFIFLLTFSFVLMQIDSAIIYLLNNTPIGQIFDLVAPIEDYDIQKTSY